MPPSQKQRGAKRAAKPVQCVFKEGGRRCVRNGAGNPALCGPHRIVAADAAQQAQPRVSTAFQQISDLFDDFLAGRPFDRQKVGDLAAHAINEAAWRMGGSYTGYHPPIVDESQIHDTDPNGYRDTRRARPRPPPGYRWHDEEPSETVDAAQLDLDRAKARATLGFGPRDVLTRDILKNRFRALAKKHHPDRGGSLERMKEISAANDILEKAIP